MLKKLLIILPLVLLATAAAALGYLATANVAPMALSFAKSNLGIDIQAENPTLKIFPSLTFTADNLTVPSLSKQGPTLLTAAHISANVGWSSFPIFWKNPTLKSITLADAKINIEQSSATSGNFMLAEEKGEGTPPSHPEDTSEPTAFVLPTLGVISLTNVDISYNNIQSKQKADIENLNLNLNGEDLTKLQAELSGMLNKKPLQGNLTTNAQNLNDIKLKGQITFGSSRANIEGGIADQKQFEGQISLQTNDLKTSMVEALTTAPATVPALPLRLTTYIKADENTYKINTLSLSLGDLLRLTGDMEGTLLPLVAKGKLNMQTSNVRTLAATLSGMPQPQAPTSGATLSTDLDYTAEKTKISNFSMALDNLLMATGTLTYEAPASTAAELKIQGNNLAALAQKLPALQGQKLPSNAYTITAIVSQKGDKFTFPSVEATISGILNLSGDITLTNGKIPNVDANINLGKADLAALGLCAEAPPQSVPSAGEAGAPTAAASSPWSDEKLDISALASATGSLKLTATNINCPTRPLQSAQLDIENTSEALNISKLNLSFAPSGNMMGSGSIGHAGGTLSPNLKISLSQYPADTLLPRASWSEGLTLPLSAEANITAKGITTRQLVKSLNGSLSANATSGRLPYSQTLTTLLNIESLLSGDPIPQGSSGQAINNLALAYTLSNGIATADKLTFSAADSRVKMDGSGTVDLPNWVINHTLLATVGNQKDIPVNITGNISSPKVGLDSAFQSRIQNRLFKEGGETVNKLLGGATAGSKTEVISNAVQNLVTGKGVDAESVNNLFGAFGKKPKPAPQEEAPVQEETAPAAPVEEDPVKNLMNNFLGQ
ncbi:MAG: hypothetical protein COY40_02005 [Alphaproteobacteria bacterium CG_4_10_14_0_8_um_filter_53_9]|nr:MAG: hypothetical protein COY40_02005 [Alphaproteobacteria bacterium CG_4_10_14_0_8_um_filter_53_9]